jgi:hypothetical protein
MIPGVTHLPRPSITRALDGTAMEASPTAAMRPSAMTTTPSSICSPVAVSTVAWTIAVACAGSGL